MQSLLLMKHLKGNEAYSNKRLKMYVYMFDLSHSQYITIFMLPNPTLRAPPDIAIKCLDLIAVPGFLI